VCFIVNTLDILWRYVCYGFARIFNPWLFYQNAIGFCSLGLIFLSSLAFHEKRNLPAIRLPCTLFASSQTSLFFLFFARQQYRRVALRCGLIRQIREMHISRDGKRTRTAARLSDAGHEVIFSLSSRRKLYALQTSEHSTADLTSFNETAIKRKRDEERARNGEGRWQ